MHFPVHLISILLQFLFLMECAALNINGTHEDYISEAFLDGRNFFPPDLMKLKIALGYLPDGVCKNDSEHVLEAIFRHETWALRMFDSSPKFPVGMLYGSHYQLGNFDECIGINTKLPQGQRVLRGQYCLADVALRDAEGHSLTAHYHQNLHSPRSYFNSTLHWSVCIPSSCSSNELEVFLTKLLNGVVSSSVIKVGVPELRCYYEQDTPFSTPEIIYGCIIGGFVVFVCLATTFHMLRMYRNRRCLVYNINTKRVSNTNIYHELIFSFSLVKNVDKLLHLGNVDESLDFIFGIKFISMFLILSSHSILFLVTGPVLNEEFFTKMVTKPQNAIVLNNPLLVDTFLLISGFLMSKLLLTELNKNKGKVNILGLYIARYIRLTPSYLVVIFFYCTVFVRIDNGPLWKERITTEKNRCIVSWWANILYINNYVNTDSICMFQSWYLSVDTHLFIVAPFVIYTLWRWHKKGEVLLGAITILMSLLVFIITYAYRLDPTLMSFPPELSDLTLNAYYVIAYIKTHMRAISYCVGLIAGYSVHRLQTSCIKLPNNILWIGWIMTFIFGTASVFSITIFYLPQYETNALESATYSCLHKVAWSFSISWIMTVCATNNAGPVKRFLSWAPFVPLSRLSYCAYLVNGAVELHSFGTLRSPNYLSIYNMAAIVLSHVLLTFTAGFILCIFFESPIHSIEKIILGIVYKKKDVRPNNEKL